MCSTTQKNIGIMYILQNQEGYFLAKSGEWVDGREPSQLFRAKHHDEAVNQLFEVNSKDFTLRITMMNCETTPKGLPLIPEDQLPPPLTATSDELAEEKETGDKQEEPNTSSQQNILELSNGEPSHTEAAAS
ncbi:MAG: hypothetical protein ACRBCI_11270 [Cellvibrionaceae bacterium]